MTIYKIRKAIKQIDASRGDPEAAHSMEDDLYQNFIEYISDGGDARTDDKLTEKATAILGTKKLDFPRWCA